MKIFITGGAGFIGSHLIEYHLSKNDEVFAIDDLSTGSLDNLSAFQEKSNFHFEEADILTWPRLESMIDVVDRVYHLAAVVGIYRVLAAPINLIDTNIAASERLIKAASFSRKNPTLLIASSSEVYGHSEKSLLNESDTLIIESAVNARWNYSISKLTDEVIALAYFKQNKLPILIIRFFNTIGPRQTGRYGMVVPRFVQQACQNQPMTIFGDGNQTRSFCDVRDTVVGLDLLMQNPKSQGEIINVGNDKEISIKQLAELIRKRANSHSEFNYLSYEEAYGEKFTDIQRRRPDLGLFLSLTDFKHQWSLEKTIDDLIQRYQQKELKMKYFGTDGIRGLVGKYPITVDFILKLGWAVGTMLAAEMKDAKVLIAKDTRVSGYMIESALQAGLSAAGVNIYLLGPLPTSAVAYLTQTLRAQIGIVISASHNPYDDNGIKFFSPEGYKLSNYYEQLIEEQLEKDIMTAPSAHLGKAWRIDDAQGRYIEFCKSSLPHRTNLHHLKIVMDCANGATYHIAPFVFRELGADVFEVNSEPNGYNINDQCGAMYPRMIQQAVIDKKADIGIAFDGDGDRLVMVDHTGEILDGDDLLFIILQGLKAAHLFKGGIVGTQMTNMNLEIALQNMQIPFLRVPVGDQYVIHQLKEKNWLLGGEPSGHIIYLNTTTTADGIITALQVLQAMQTLNKNLHELRNSIKKFPQKIINIPYHDVNISLSHPKIEQILQSAKKKLGERGRVLLRYSGTEPVIRLMVEGENNESVNTLSEEISSIIRQLIDENIR